MINRILSGRAACAALAAVAISTAVLPSAAQAGDRTRTAVGVGVAAGALGLALGAAAANEDREVVYEERRRPRCWIERQEVEDSYGDIHIRRVRVCD